MPEALDAPGQALTILAVDDDAGDAEILKRQLARVPGLTFEFHHAASEAEAAAELSRGAVDVTFLDYQLGSSTGLEMLRSMRAAGDGRAVVVLTGQGDAYTAVEFARAGADEYLIKTDLSPERLLRAMHNAMNERDRRCAERSDTGAAATACDAGEASTQLMSSSAWSESALQAHEGASSGGRVYCVMVLALDHARALRDTAGQAAAEACLCAVVECLRATCRRDAALCRIGEDEFGILLPETSEEQALVLAERIRKAVWDRGIPHPSSPVAERVTVSLGVGSSPAHRWEDVLSDAEEGQHIARTLGGNMVWGQDAARSAGVSAPSGGLLNIISIDDDASDAELLRRRLESAMDSPFRFTHCATPTAARSELLRRPESAVFLDYRLGADCGLDVLREFRSAGFMGPIIALTGEGDEYIVAELMRGGADDYIAKADISADLLERALRNAESRHSRRKVEQRNRHLLAELRSAKRSLEKKNERLTELYRTAHQFVDNVSHEFRTPLTVIKEFTSILRDGIAGGVNAEQREYLDIVLNRTDDLSTMVDDMLDISKLEAGVLGVSRRVCTVSEIIDDVRTTLDRKAQAAQVTLTIASEGALPTIYCDPEKIGRVLVNLSINAIKFCNPQGHVRIEADRPSPGGAVRFRITDDGPGIAPENLQAIFERFKQIDGGARSSTKGFGLGLSIAKELVHLNFGEITVESEVGRGSTFTFTVPTAEPRNVLALYLERRRPSVVSLLIATASDGVDSVLLDGVEDFLQHQLRRSDLLFRARPTRWLIVAAASGIEIERMVSRLEQALAEINRNRPGHELPRFLLTRRGTWHGSAHRDELLQTFADELRSDGIVGCDDAPIEGESA